MYSNRIVAFIDILGFKGIVQDKKFDEVVRTISEFTKWMENADKDNTTNIAIAQSVQKKFDKELIKFDENSQNLTFFSDCVVWSYPIEKIKIDVFFALNSLISALVKLQFILLSKSILVRGGVTLGEIYHDESKVFGPALIKAYQLEQVAKYPRIIFDIEFLSQFNNQYLKLIKPSVTFTNKGFFYIDLFRYIKSVNNILPNNDTTKIILNQYVQSISKTIISGRKFKDIRIREKYDWMENKLKNIGDLQVPIKL